jgi:GTP-binding protein HflX
VGFIRNLPTTLIKAFRATLEEVTEASLLVHVVDASSPYAPEQTAHVLKVLAEIGADRTRQILALNKIDLIEAPDSDPRALAQRILGETQTPGGARAIALSARSGRGFEDLLQAIDELLPIDPITRAKFRFPASDGSLPHLLHEHGRVLSTRYDGDVCEVEADVPESLRSALAAHVFE